MRPVDLQELSDAITARQYEWTGGSLVGPVFAMMELLGEAGELANVVKKIERKKHGWIGGIMPLEHLEQLEDEMADVLITLDLLAKQYHVDLSLAVVKKFNHTSRKHGLSTMMRGDE